jgi:hypothetical protein
MASADAFFKAQLFEQRAQFQKSDVAVAGTCKKMPLPCEAIFLRN